MTARARRVLIADDDPVMTRACVRLLRPHLQVLVAHSLADALRIIAAEKTLDAVWSDRHLPEANRGVSVLRAAAERHPSALLLLVTADPGRRGLETLPPGVHVFDKSDAAEAVALMVQTLS